MSKLKYRTLRENVVEVIRTKILHHQLKPGMRIIEQDLSEELEVSRGPIREALRQLEQEGLVEYTRNVGCSIKEISLRDLYEIYLLRSTYEILAVRLCEGKYDEEDFLQMEQILEQMKSLQNYEEVVEADHKFHQIIVEKAHSKRIEKVWADLDYGSIVSCYIKGFNEEETVKRQFDFHKKLVDAFRTQDVDNICRELKEHYIHSLDRFRMQSKSGKEELTFFDVL